MNTITDLGAIVKLEYPNMYNDLSDTELGFCVKTEYPDYYYDFVDTEAQYLQARAESEINRNTSSFNSSMFLFLLGTGLILTAFYFAYNYRSFDNSVVIWIIAIVLFCLSFPVFTFGGKVRREEYEFAKEQIADRLSHEAAQEQLRKTIANRPVEEEERQKRIAQLQYDRISLMAKLRNELIITDAANRLSMSPGTYSSIQLMEAQARIELKTKAEGLKLDAAHARELKQIELDAEQTLADLDLRMADVKLLMPFHELSVLNNQLAGFYLELEKAKLLPQTDYKMNETNRITKQIKTWASKIGNKAKQL